MNSPSNFHLLVAFFGAIIITLAGIAREIGIDTNLNSSLKGVLYLSIVLAITLVAILMIRKL